MYDDDDDESAPRTAIAVVGVVVVGVVVVVVVVVVHRDVSAFYFLAAFSALCFCTKSYSAVPGVRGWRNG